MRTEGGGVVKKGERGSTQVAVRVTVKVSGYEVRWSGWMTDGTEKFHVAQISRPGELVES